MTPDPSDRRAILQASATGVAALGLAGQVAAANAPTGGVPLRPLAAPARW